MIRKLLLMSAYSLILLVSGSCSLWAQSPNIIIILTDDQGYGDVGFNGCQDIPTPNMDRIAGNGVKFTNGYVSYAVCGPSRAGLITGRYQDRFGFGRNPILAPEDPNVGLPLSEETLATVLKRVGYRSMAIGKWHSRSLRCTVAGEHPGGAGLYPAGHFSGYLCHGSSPVQCSHCPGKTARRGGSFAISASRWSAKGTASAFVLAKI